MKAKYVRDLELLAESVSDGDYKRGWCLPESVYLANFFDHDNSDYANASRVEILEGYVGDILYNK